MRTSKTALFVWILACVLVFAGAAWAGRSLFATDAPLGVPLPPARPAIFTILPREQAGEATWEERTTTDAWLEYMAPQPDGMPPLRWPYSSELGDFNISHPHGTETTQVMSVDQHGIVTDAIGVFHYGWPVVTYIYQMSPRREGETAAEFTARYEHELTVSGAKLIGNHGPLELPAYKFQHFEYMEAQPANGQAYSHYIYLGPFGSRVLVLDYKCLAEQHEQARPLVEKMIGSFEPGWELKKLMLKEAPKYGELAGTPLGEQPTNLAAAK